MVGVKSKISMKLIGDDGISGIVTLSKDGFWKGSRSEKTIKADKVGNIEMIKLYNEGT
jgi:hypothetical protein